MGALDDFKVDIEIFILIGLFSLVRTHKSSGELERAGKCNQILQIVRLFTTIGSKHRSCRSLQDSRISLMTLGRNLKTTTKRRAQSSEKRLILGKTLDQAQDFFFVMGPSQVFVVDSRGRRDCIIYAKFNTA